VSPSVLPCGSRDTRDTRDTRHSRVLSVLPVHLVLWELRANLLDLVGQVGDGTIDVLESPDEEVTVLLLPLARDSRDSRDSGDSGDSRDALVLVSKLEGGGGVEEEGHDGDQQGNKLVHGGDTAVRV
jgi:hypothetical protein